MKQIVVFVLGAALGLAASSARAEETRFAVVDISPTVHNDKVAGVVEGEVSRLRGGARPLDDATMRRLLATGEGPIAAANRLTREAQERRAANDCAGAVDRVTQAEALTLSSVPIDDERDLLRSQYVVLVACQHELGHGALRDAAASRLRSLVSLPPPRLPQELWDKYVAPAVPPPATIELHVDSDPANAQVQINFHGEGVTPRTLKVPRGTIYVEVQKDGYLKAFRKLEVGTEPMRTAFRLVERTHDRVDQALATLNLLRRSDAGAVPHSQTLARLAQLARADVLVVMSLTAPDHVNIWFFDADRGALSTDSISSAVDPATGKVAELSARNGPPAPAVAASGPTPPPPSSQGAPAASPGALQKGAGAPPASNQGLPEAQARQAPPSLLRRRARTPTPWWSWLIAAAIGGSLLVYVYMDRPQQQSTLDFHATWTPPTQ